MSFFSRRPAFTPPLGLSLTPQRLMKTVRFVYDEQGTPAFAKDGKLDKLAKSGAHDKLLKGQQAGEEALKNLELRGLRAQMIVLLDGSGSMMSDYRNGKVKQMLIRTLGFTLNLDPDGEIPVIVYGGSVNRPVDINTGNYQQADQLVRPDFGSTSMTQALATALELAAKYGMLTIIVNITDGNPNNQVTMSNQVILSSGYPCIVKNLAIRPVSYLQEIDTLPSQIEVKKDANDNPVRDANGDLILERNPAGIRLIDNVNSQAFDPGSVTDAQFAAYVAEEIPVIVEVMGRVGILTGVPGVTKTETV
jgi:hypothetical protein